MRGKSERNEIAWYKRETNTSIQFSTSHKGLVSWLRNEFGHGALNKKFPAWAFSCEEKLRKALLEGYVSADGCNLELKGVKTTETVTVSKALAFSVKAIVESLGFTAQVSEPRANSTVIEGRTVNSKPIYMVRWRELPKRTQNIRDGIHNWTRVQKVSEELAELEVFNISVEDDETYIADGIVVHNCKQFSKV